MKKLVKILLPFLCLNASLLSACGKDEKIQLTFGNINATQINDKVSTNDLDLKIKHKESFLVVVGDTTCACWSQFRPIINAYVLEKHVDCMFFTYNSFKNKTAKYEIEANQGSTTFVIYEKGAVKVQLQSGKAGKTMTDKETFNNFMNDTVKLPKAYFIEEKDYSTVTENGAIIYFERSGCGDCSYLNPTVIANYVEKHPDMNNIYVLDCQVWKDELDVVKYQAKKNNYGLSTTNNPDYGYDTGVFPYMSYVKAGYWLSGAVAFNDEVSKQGNKYVITNSYYTEERLSKLDYLSKVDTKVLKGLELPASDVSDNGEWISWEKEKAVKYYEPIIDAFLDTYLPQVSYKI